jgi:MFS family permease
MLPLFVLAHFGHHVVGAMLRPLSPMIKADLGLTNTEIGFIFSAFALVGGVSQLPAGWLADRFGARLMVALGVSGVAVVGLFVGLSQSYALLIVLLSLAALLGGGYHPASTAAISATVTPERIGRSLGIHLIGGSSCFWVVPLLAAPIAAAIGWRGTYVVLAAPAIALGIALYVLIGRRQRVVLSAAVPSTAESAEQREKIPWRRLAPFVVMSVAAGTMIQSVFGFIPLYANEELGVTQAAAGMLVAISPAVGLFAAPLGGNLADRVGPLPVLLGVSFIAVPLVFLLGVVPNVTLLVVVMFFVGVTSNARMPTSESYIVGNTPTNRRSTVLGIYFFAGAEVSALLSPVVGSLTESVGYRPAFLIVGLALGAIVVVCSLILWRTRGQR